jgi:hypothetical protein
MHIEYQNTFSQYEAYYNQGTHDFSKENKIYGSFKVLSKESTHT